MIGEYLFKFIVFGLIAYGAIAIFWGKVISDPENGEIHMIHRDDDPQAFWTQVVCVFLFAAMMLWAGYIYGPSQAKKQMLKKCDPGDEHCQQEFDSNYK